MYRRVLVQDADFVMQDIVDDLRGRLGEQMGAMSLFCGLVRDRHDDAKVDTLYLEHYPGMTEASIERILDQAGQRWALQAAVVVHRVGALSAGDQIVLVVTAAAHRAAALDATTFIIDYLKTDAVFWKRETLDSHARWIESKADDYQRSRSWRGGRGR